MSIQSRTSGMSFAHIRKKSMKCQVTLHFSRDLLVALATEEKRHCHC